MVIEELLGTLPSAHDLARILLRLLAALAVGALIGYQREKMGKAAGFRTHLLVSMGTALLVISAQEAARVAVEALINGDVQALGTVIVTEADIQALRLPAAVAKQVQESTSDISKKAQAALADSKVLNSKSQWVRFDAPLPGLVLADDLGTARAVAAKSHWEP